MEVVGCYATEQLAFAAVPDTAENVAGPEYNKHGEFTGTVGEFISGCDRYTIEVQHEDDGKSIYVVFKSPLKS